MIRRLANFRRSVVLLLGTIVFTLGIALSSVRPPLPCFPDEFSYQLAGDTFAKGRLTNAPHRYWPHFESFHILQQPTYASMYPPVEGLFLALGLKIGSPIAGIALLGGLAAAAACWMLQAWVPPRWALVGGAIVVFSTGFEIVWGQSYWGGSHAFLGGSLVYGGLARFRSKNAGRAALVMITGAIVLANCRPYEGLVVAIPAAIWAATRWVGWLRSREYAAAGRAVVAVALPAIAAAVAMCYLNYRVTGDPLLTPQVLNYRTYHATPVFLDGEFPPEPEYRHEAFRKLYAGWARRPFERDSMVPDLVSDRDSRNAGELRSLLLPTLLLVPGLFAGGTIVSRKTLAALGILVWFVAAELRVPNWLFHYFAPIAPLVLFLVVQGFRRLYTLDIGRFHVGRIAVCLLLGVYAADFTWRTAAYASTETRGFPRWRHDLARRLEQQGGRHLVIVRYGPGHNVHEEWVYNGADIDGSPVVWARGMSAAEDRKLIDYFGGYRPWLLKVDENEPVPEPYPESSPRR